MKDISEGIKQSSLVNQKIRKAAFVDIESSETNKFKYNLKLDFIKYFKDKLIVFKTNCNKLIQGPQLWFNKIDLKAVRSDTGIWLAEVFIEGIVVNFAISVLTGLSFNLMTIFAWGIAIKELVSIYWRLKNNGTPATIPQKHE